MAHLKYYADENIKYKQYVEMKLSIIETRYIFNKLQSHYKFNQNLEFRNRSNGHCSRLTIKLPAVPNLHILIHECAHAIQLKKIRLHKERFHTKKHERIMNRIYKYALPKLDDWRLQANKKQENRIASIERKKERKLMARVNKISPEYKLELVNAAIKRWETKKKRAENTLKKLHRRQKIYTNKLTQD